jgi:quercetin dioxygenase-like cupin family protein
MSFPHLESGEVVQLALGNALETAKTTTLVKTTSLELIRLVLHAGKEIPSHQAPGEITVQCLEGRVAFTAEGKTQELTGGQLLYLADGKPHSLKAIEGSSLLVTLLQPKSKPAPRLDVVQEASEESFPASDAPAY